VLAQQLSQVLAIDLGAAGGGGQIAAVAGQQGLDVSPFEVVDDARLGFLEGQLQVDAGTSWAPGVRDDGRSSIASAISSRAPRDRAQARSMTLRSSRTLPGSGADAAAGPRRRGSASCARRRTGGELGHQQRDVVGPVAQRRHPDAHHASR